MSPRRRWLAVTVVVWAIPAFMGWLLVGALLGAAERRDHASRIDRLHRSLIGVVPSEVPGLGWIKPLQLESQLLGDLGSDPERLAQHVAARESTYPPGAVRLFLFDRQGQLAAPRAASEAAAVRALVALVRQFDEDARREFGPARAAAVAGLAKIRFRRTRLATATAALLATIVPDPAAAVASLLEGDNQVVGLPASSRAPGGILASATAWGPAAGFPDAAVRYLARESETGPVAGMLLLVWWSRLMPADGRLEFLRPPDDPEPVIGFLPDVGGASWSGRLPVEIARGCEAIAARQLTGEARHRDHLLVMRRIRRGCLVAVLPAHPPARGLVLGLGVVYSAGSIWLLQWLYGLAVGGRQLGWSLRRKLVVLLVFGIALPLAGATVVAGLQLWERDAARLAARRLAAEARIDELDAGYEQYVTEHELALRAASGGFASMPPPPAVVERRFLDLHGAGLIDAFVILDAEAQLLARCRTAVNESLFRLLRLPLAERQQRFAGLIARGYRPGFERSTLLVDPRPWAERLDELRDRAVDEVEIGPASRWLAREAVAHANRQRGRTAGETGKAGMVIAGMFAPELDNLGRLGMACMESITRYQGPLGGTLTFFRPIEDGTRRVRWFLQAESTIRSMEECYLAVRFGAWRAGDDRGLAAVPAPDSLQPGFPTEEVAVSFASVAHRLLGQPREVLHAVQATPGGEVELTARRGYHLSSYVLIAVTPVAEIAVARAAARWHAAGLLALTGAFCGALVWVTWLRLLPPVHLLVGGIAAMRRRCFDLRLDSRRADELGRLFGAFNLAMASLADMQLAATIQTRILPRGELRVGRFRLIHANEMTQATGGDFVDRFQLSDGRIVAVLGDVTGHGIGPAMVTAMARAAVREFAPRFPDRPDEVLRQMHLMFLEILERTFAMTCVLAVLEPVSGLIRLANAGHAFPLRWTPGSPVEFIEARATFPVGAARRCSAAVVEVTFPPQSLPAVTAGPDTPPAGAVVFYSDGLVEPLGPDGTPFGFDRFREAVGEALARHPDAPGPALFAAVRRHTDPVPWGDDATVLFIIE